jgi:hypothetical protein
MAEHRIPDEERASTYGLDLRKAKDRKFYTQLTSCPRMLRMWVSERERIARQKS